MPGNLPARRGTRRFARTLPMFAPLETARLVVRPATLDDLEALVARRSAPEAARYQDWPVPYPRDQAEQLLRSVESREGPADDQWYMLTIALHDGTVVGDLALFMTFNMRHAEVGFTLHPDYWGHGYATEALKALVEHLFTTVGVTRVQGRLNPDNRASALVLERVGFVWEGMTRLSFWARGENTDEWIYGLTRPDWEAWNSRPRHSPTEVTLHPIDQSNESKVYKLKTHYTQRDFVAPMEWSFTDALFPEIVNGAPTVPWMRAVHADGDLVAFVMLALRTAHHPEPYLWRLLVDRMHQRRGIGTRILDLIVEECRAMGDDRLRTSWAPGRGTPEPFYLGYGFVPTGDIVDDEIEATLSL